MKIQPPDDILITHARKNIVETNYWNSDRAFNEGIFVSVFGNVIHLFLLTLLNLGGRSSD